MLAFLPAYHQKTVDLISSPGVKNATCHWKAVDAQFVRQEGRDGIKIFSLKGSPYGMNGMMTTLKFAKPPTKRQLNFSVALKGAKDGDTYSVVCIATTKPKEGKLNWAQEWQDDGKLDSRTWRVMRRTYVASPDTVMLTLMIHSTGKNPITFGNAHMMVGPAAPVDKKAIAKAQKTIAEYEYEKAHPSDSYVQKNHDALAKQVGPVVIRVVQRAPLCTEKEGEEGTITIPLPSRDASQIPIGFRLTCDKPGKLIDFKWRRREDGRLLCDARVVPGKKGSWLTCESLVLVHAGPAVTDKGADSHLDSTACVQSADPRVAAIAKKLAEGATGDESYAAKVFTYVRDNRGLGKPFTQLDAVAALDCGGSCTNQANLSAALLRAHGLPARTVAHMPTWCGKLYEHWLTEYWTGSEWVALDPSLGRWKPDRRTRVEFGYASTDDENRAFDKQHLRFVMPGAPYQSVVELTSTLYPANLAADDAINWAEQVCLLPSASEASVVAKAGARFDTLFELCSRGEMDLAGFAKALDAAKKKSVGGCSTRARFGGGGEWLARSRRRAEVGRGRR